MLPLKAGIGIMALGAMAKYNCTVTIVPCGLNYFKVKMKIIGVILTAV